MSIRNPPDTFAESPVLYRWGRCPLWASIALASLVSLSLNLGWTDFQVASAQEVVPATVQPAEPLSKLHENTPHWQVAENDCHARMVSYRRIAAEPDHPASDQIRIVTGPGTYALVVYPIQPLAVIDELDIRVPFFAASTGQQVMVRVVLPRSVDPKTGQPLSVHVRGDIYERPGVWTKLRMPNLAVAMEGQIRILRSQYGSQVDGREAYVDQVLLNVYTRQGISAARIGDPEIRGAVLHGRTHLPQPVQTASAERSIDEHGEPAIRRLDSISPNRDISYRIEGNLLLVDDRPFFVRGIQARGEDWKYLRRMGFNTLQLSEPVTFAQIQEAEQLGLWLIAPPPEAWKGGDLGQPYRRVLAWDLGNHLTSRDLHTFRERAKAVRASDNATRRPILCGCDNDLATFDEVADILLHHREPIGSNFPINHYRGWLASRPAFALAGTPHWAMIQTEPLPSVVAQARAFGRSEAEIEQTLCVNADEIEALALSSIASGMRGLLFASSHRLDYDSAATQERASALRALNLKLDTIEPWIAGGHVAARDIGNTGEAPTTILRTARSWLVLPSDAPKSDHKYSELHRNALHHRAAQSGSGMLTIPGIPTAIDVFQFQPVGLGRLQHERMAGGVRLEQRPGLNRMLLLTRDPLVVRHVHRKLNRSAAIASELQRRLADDLYARTERLLLRLGRSNERLLSAGELLTACDPLVLAKDYDSIHRNCAYAAEILRAVRDQVAREQSPATTTAPWSGHLDATAWPLHARSAKRESTNSLLVTSENELLDTGDLEDLATMRKAGWRNWEHAPEWVSTHVELSTDRPHHGERFLRLSTRLLESQRGEHGQLEKPPLWITSPALSIAPGTQLVIRGWIRMQEPPTHCHDGILLFDSLGGPSLAVPLEASNEWQPFSTTRVVDASGEVTVTLAVSGIGQVDLDGLSIREVKPSRLE